MTYVDRFATYLAESIRHNKPESSSVAVLRYALIALINQAITMAIVLVVAAITGDILKALAASLLFPLLRNYSGGFHFQNATLCNWITAAFVLVSVYVPVDFWYNGIILSGATVVILLLNAPAGIKRSRIDKKHFPVLKLVAVGIVSINFFLQIPFVSVLFFIQALTTFPFLQRIVDKLKL
ncbi:accessory gene regulator B [Paenibacillus sp. UNCCL117]|uniref:accessory gene regulator B family protein n=1 Tax=unclassified Paenibacillus TaxID=185978 RepID=UPI00088C7C29|nr:MULTISPECIES: accessory gene regulator B family protein [unclassified Paenibacillus]SDD28951.1 accessory gene regulator B [Paenibacillus sp. cl123]SFW40832.1 accessory gene regulator B [Paenibacillus sp. UNCCL117]